jgi:hypothetical protein
MLDKCDFGLSDLISFALVSTNFIETIFCMPVFSRSADLKLWNRIGSGRESRGSNGCMVPFDGGPAFSFP